MVDNSFVSNPEKSDDPKPQPRSSAPDGGLNDGFAAIAVLAFVVALIVLAIRFL